MNVHRDCSLVFRRGPSRYGSVRGGFTLIEALVYLALLSIIVFGIVLSAFALFESADRNRAAAILQEEKSFLLAKIDWALDDAVSVSEPPLPLAPAATSVGSTLSLVKYDGTPMLITLSGEALESATSGPARRLNSARIAVANLLFVRFHDAALNLESIEAGLTVSTRLSGGRVVSQTASTTRYLRP